MTLLKVHKGLTNKIFCNHGCIKTLGSMISTLSSRNSAMNNDKDKNSRMKEHKKIILINGREGEEGGFENACSVIAVLEKICKIFFL